VLKRFPRKRIFTAKQRTPHAPLNTVQDLHLARIHDFIISKPGHHIPLETSVNLDRMRRFQQAKSLIQWVAVCTFSLLAPLVIGRRLNPESHN
jgi:hypothetical protein